MPLSVDPRKTRPATPVRNAPETRTLRTSETLSHQQRLAYPQKETAPKLPEAHLYAAIQARYG